MLHLLKVLKQDMKKKGREQEKAQRLQNQQETKICQPRLSSSRQRRVGAACESRESLGSRSTWMCEKLHAEHGKLNSGKNWLILCSIKTIGSVQSHIHNFCCKFLPGGFTLKRTAKLRGKGLSCRSFRLVSIINRNLFKVFLIWNPAVRHSTNVTALIFPISKQ